MPKTVRADPLLQALSPGERQVLALLASGHTAKSIAAELNLSVNAVNERLREARRKTGAGSSRELARQVAAQTFQENRDENIGLAASHGAGRRGKGPTRGAWARLGVPLMILAALFVFAALPSPQSTAPVKDPLLGLLLNNNGTDPRELHAWVRAEPRDMAAEAVVRSRYRELPDLKSTTTLRVICGLNLCEVAAGVPNGHSLVAIQELGLSGLKNAGFTSTYFAVGPGKHRPAFVTYLKRVANTR